jgi:type II secretory pathway pseudopilin PulG
MDAIILAIAVIASLSMSVLPLMALRKRRRRNAILAEQLRQWQQENAETGGVGQSAPR